MIRISRRAPPARKGAAPLLAAVLGADTDEKRAACAWLADVGQALLDLATLARGRR